MVRIWERQPVINAIADNPLDDAQEKHLLDDDLFGLEDRLAPAFDMIRHPQTHTPFSIAIFGSWGTGKSTAMHWLDLALKRWNDQDERTKKDVGNPYIQSLWFHPWKYETKEDVWHGLIAEVILACLDDNPSQKDIEDLFKCFGESVIDIVSGFKGWSGVRKSADHVKNYVKPHQSYLNASEETFKTWVKAALKKKENSRLVIFIDDLDRCAPQVAMQVLEALKLYFTIENLVFVIGIDQQVIVELVSNEYEGIGIKTEKGRDYLAKMFQVEIPLDPNREKIEKYTHTLCQQAWGNLGLDDETFNAFKGVVMSLGKRNPREIKRLINYCQSAVDGDEISPEDIKTDIFNRLLRRCLGNFGQDCQYAFGERDFPDFLRLWQKLLKIEDAFELRKTIAGLQNWHENHMKEGAQRPESLPRQYLEMLDYSYFGHFQNHLGHEDIVALLSLGIIEFEEQREEREAPQPQKMSPEEIVKAFRLWDGEEQESGPQLLQMIEDYPYDVTLRRIVAKFYEDNKKFRKADEHYQVALDLESDDAGLLGDYANFLEKQGEMDQAGTYYQKALSADPGHVDILGNYANFLVKQGDMDQAGVYYEKALSLDPDHAHTLGNYALFLAQQGDMDQAGAYYQKALSVDPDHAAILGKYAVFLEKKGDMDQAGTYYQKALSADPDHVPTLYNYADFLEKQGEMDQAETYYQKALSVDPDHAHTLGNYAEFLLLHRDRQQAIEHVQDCLKRLQDPGILLCLYFMLYALLPDHELGQTAQGEINRLLKEGVRHLRWNFDDVLAKAKENGHPDDDRLEQLAKQINTPVADEAP